MEANSPGASGALLCVLVFMGCVAFFLFTRERAVRRNQRIAMVRSPKAATGVQRGTVGGMLRDVSPRSWRTTRVAVPNSASDCEASISRLVQPCAGTTFAWVHPLRPWEQFYGQQKPWGFEVYATRATRAIAIFSVAVRVAPTAGGSEISVSFGAYVWQAAFVAAVTIVGIAWFGPDLVPAFFLAATTGWLLAMSILFVAMTSRVKRAVVGVLVRAFGLEVRE